ASPLGKLSPQVTDEVPLLGDKASPLGKLSPQVTDEVPPLGIRLPLWVMQTLNEHEPTAMGEFSDCLCREAAVTAGD
ncbi:MAG: hypothetical protein IJL98_04195, partial [Lachnospiraceae bacterium]|nr:hypothetical protein [Lachnospiraceae bacterium]